ncbi:hypothetical protein HOY82DRAFT_408407 [Tuber indicum]|nr:hypothetical protein HOY82DRAFT_408407 [Tuber indicum]
MYIRDPSSLRRECTIHVARRHTRNEHEPRATIPCEWADGSNPEDRAIFMRPTLIDFYCSLLSSSLLLFFAFCGPLRTSSSYLYIFSSGPDIVLSTRCPPRQEQGIIVGWPCWWNSSNRYFYLLKVYADSSANALCGSEGSFTRFMSVLF